MSEVQQVSLALIDPPLIRMREQFGDAAFAELVEDIGKNGITVPVKLQKTGERFRVIYGDRRTTAARTCGLETVPAIVVQVDELEEVRQMVSENTGREDVSDAEKGRHYLELMEHFKFTVEQVAAMVRKSVQYVDERVELVTFDDDIANANRDGLISWSVAKELCYVNPYTWARALRTDVANCDEALREKITQHRKFLLDLCIRCGATGKVARGYVDQWKKALIPILPYEPRPNGDAAAPPAAAQAPRCVVCGRDADQSNMLPIMVHHWERAGVLKILRASGMEVYE
jgi:ParB/RepB/Spo0J family partition protein